MHGCGHDSIVMSSQPNRIDFARLGVDDVDEEAYGDVAGGRLLGLKAVKDG
jgi:hypothetical protein